MKIYAVFLIALLCYQLNGEAEYRKIIHKTDPEAKCLDGSPSLLYLHQGNDKNKFLIYFVGGGLCSGLTLNQTLDDCLKRSQTELGSSKYWPDHINASSLGYLSTNPVKSKFATWTKLIFAYCDSSLHQGYRKSSVSYKGKELFFRGNAITRSHFKWLLKEHNFNNAEEVVITGLSAGGIGTFLWSNYVRTIIKNPTNVISIPDSGIFPIFPNYVNKDINVTQTMAQNVFKLANIDEKTPLAECNQAYLNQEWKCLFFQYAFQFQQSRTLVINSQYDAYSLGVDLQMSCLSQGKQCMTLAQCKNEELVYIQGFRKKFTGILTQYLKNQQNSAWLISCSCHGYASNKNYEDNKEKVPQNKGLTVKQAIDEFVFQRKRVISVDILPWPENHPCAF